MVWVVRGGAAIVALGALAGALHAQAPTTAERALGYRLDRVIVRPAAPAGTATSPAADEAARRRFASAAELATTAPSRAALHTRLGLRTRRTHPALGGLEVLTLPPALAPAQALAELRNSGLYATVEPDYVRSIRLAPNDPRYTDGTLWGLHNTGQSSGTVDADIDAPEAWSIRTDASGVIVGVIDTGIRLTHLDLAANLWVNPGEIAGNGRDDDGNGYIDDVHGINALNGSGNPTDDNGHGTHCAGTIGGVGNNATGITGVAWRVQLMALKFLDDEGYGSDSDAIECMAYARARGARILSNSWGDTTTSNALRDAVNACRTAGVIFVAASGNDAADTDATPHYPSSYALDNVVAVAATNRTDGLAWFSNYGFGSVQLAAPGEAIYSAVQTSNSAYDTYSGTSMATPHVAGALALLAAQFPADTYAQLINRLLRGVDPLSALTGKTLTGGRLNLHRALTTTRNSPPHDDLATAYVLPAATTFKLWTSNQAATAEAGEPTHAGASARRSVWLRWTAPVSGAASVTLAGSGFDTRLAIYTGETVDALTLRATNDDASAGLVTSAVTFPALAGRTYHYAIDGAGEAAGTIVLAQTFVAGNQRPVVTAATVTPASRGYADQPVVVTEVVATDPEEEPVTLAFQWESSLDGAAWTATAGETTATLAAADDRAGRFWRCRLIASDPTGAGSPFVTAAVGIERRAPATAVHGTAFAFAPALPLVTATATTYARAAWINEFSQGPVGSSSEWVELLVLNTSDLRGWTLRDSGVSSGLTFASTNLWSGVPAGTLIVIYNQASKDSALPALDADLADGRLVLPSTSPYFTGTWASLGNSGDAIVLRSATAAVLDGISYGNNSSHAPVLTQAGSGRAARFTGDSLATIDTTAGWATSTSTAANVTPGAGNSAANTAFVTALRSTTTTAPAHYALVAGSVLPPGLDLDAESGLISGVIDAPAGGFFTFTVRRATNLASITRTVQLLVGSAAGVFTVPAGETWTLSADLTLTGALVTAGAIDHAGHTLTVVRTFPAWAELRLAAYSPLGDDRLPGGDPDGDGLVNAAEFALALDPVVADAAGVPALGFASSGAGERATLTFQRLRAPRLVTYSVEWSGDLVAWTTFDLEAHLVGVPQPDPADAGYETVTVFAPDAATGARVFLRVRVE